MSEKFELKLLRSIKTGKGLIKLITALKKSLRIHIGYLRKRKSSCMNSIELGGRCWRLRRG
jgi:hypothetical protein